MDTNLVNLTTVSSISINVTAMSESLNSASHTFEFDFYSSQKDKLNTLPVAAVEEFLPGYIEVNLNEPPSEPSIFTFTFNDTDKHNMTIYAEGN